MLLKLCPQMLATFCQLFLHGFQTDIRRTEYQSLFEAFEIDDDANEDSTFLDLSVQVWLCLLSNFQKQGGWLEEGSLQ